MHLCLVIGNFFQIELSITPNEVIFFLPRMFLNKKQQEIIWFDIRIRQEGRLRSVLDRKISLFERVKKFAMSY